MRTVTNTSLKPAHDAFTEKKSEFIGDMCHISTLDEAAEVVATIREQHPKARHVAYAAVCGDANGRLCERMSDDGEPSGTAGKPILDVIRSADLTDCVITVTRYFGGILLGSGGLTRAYSRAASLALNSANIADIVECYRLNCNVEYQNLRMLKHLIMKADGSVENETYGVNINLDIIVPIEKEEELVTQVNNTFAGAVKLVNSGKSRMILPRK